VTDEGGSNGSERRYFASQRPRAGTDSGRQKKSPPEFRATLTGRTPVWQFATAIIWLKRRSPFTRRDQKCLKPAGVAAAHVRLSYSYLQSVKQIHRPTWSASSRTTCSAATSVRNRLLCRRTGFPADARKLQQGQLPARLLRYRTGHPRVGAQPRLPQAVLAEAGLDGPGRHGALCELKHPRAASQ